VALLSAGSEQGSRELPRPPVSPPVAVRQPLETPLRWVAAAASFGAAAIHFSVMPGHWQEWAAAGLFFGLTAWAQVGWGVAVLQTRSREVLTLGLLGQLSVICLWVVSRTAGLPAGPNADQPEKVAFIDSLCSALEGVAIVAAALLLIPRTSTAAWRRPLAFGGAALLIAGIVGSTTASLVPSVGGHEHEHGTTATGGHTHGAVVRGNVPAGWVAGCHAHTSNSGDIADVGHAPGSCSDAPVTAEQRAAAERLVADTTGAVANRYPTLQAAEKAGYRVINATGPLIHVGNPAFQNDGRVLDPQRVESLVYVSVGKASMLLGAMYFAEPSAPQGPLIGGALTAWHIHTNLCVNPSTGTALNPEPGNRCAPGSAIGPTAQMLHVWTIPYEGGPFADISTPALFSAVTQELQRRAAAQPSRRPA
jgi:hypothetical protein